MRNFDEEAKAIYNLLFSSHLSNTGKFDYNGIMDGIKGYLEKAYLRGWGDSIEVSQKVQKSLEYNKELMTKEEYKDWNLSEIHKLLKENDE